MKTQIPIAAVCTFVLTAATSSLDAAIVSVDTFGSGANTFSVDFVTVGNAGNADAGGGLYSSPYGGVPYE